MTEAIVRYFHFLGIVVLASMLVIEHVLISTEMKIDEVKRIARIDAIYGISALVVLIAGLTLWFGVGKPTEFYSGNILFHIKVGLFILMFLISIIPTIFFIKNYRRGDVLTPVPKYIVNLIRFELLLLIIIPLLAVMMARGIGFS